VGDQSNTHELKIRSNEIGNYRKY